MPWSNLSEESAIINSTLPQTLILAGLDPAGGAGIQADIQAVTALGGHPLPVVTCLTVQNTHNVYNATPVDPDFIRQQLECLAKDTPFHAVKTGALGNAQVVEVVAGFLGNYPDIPLIVDPVIKAAGGGDLADEALLKRMAELLFPRSDVITPNGIELTMLGNSDQPDEAAENLHRSGCPSVLATGGHGSGDFIRNRLYRQGQETAEWQIPRRGGEYHGSGCTLAAAIAAGRAAGLNLEQAIEQAQQFVSAAIAAALQVGSGQPVPNRAANNK